MSEQKTVQPLRKFVEVFLQQVMINYWGPLYNYLKDSPHLIKTAPGFLINHDEVTVYVGRTHIALEYHGSEVADELPAGKVVTVNMHDYSTKECNIFERIIGFEYDSNMIAGMSLPLPPFSEDLLLPTNRGWDKLEELQWNFSAQNSIMGFNVPSPAPLPGRFTRVVNGMFFDADESGLRTRRIKWLDFFPIEFDGSNEEHDTFSFSVENLRGLVEHDAHYKYPLPDEYKFKQLPKINKFIEAWGSKESSEPDITSFLARDENKFILTMNFGASNVHAELTCDWQSEARNSIRPDFFVVKPNGYADIVEFKLPQIDKAVVVGGANRETFAAWLQSYVSQTRVYASYFEDPNNRAWFEKKYGLKVFKPRRYLVVGRRKDFDSDVWREIMSDYPGLDIMTFDDLVDGVVAQFYMD